MPEIDLHTHTTASDGTMRPAELVAEAGRVGLRALAVTDHDTVAGLPEAALAGAASGLELIRGVELSVDFSPGVMHIVGLWLPHHPHALESFLAELRAKRHERNVVIMERLRLLGLDVTYEEVLAIAGEASVGRPHISRLLMDKGAVRSVRQAFDEYLGPKGKAYVPKAKFPPAKAVGILKDEGATVILAHPCTLPLDSTALFRVVSELRGHGLDGLEVQYSEHTPNQTREFLGLARRLELLVSGGSDFHGAVKPDIGLGVGHGNLDIPYALVEAMKERRVRDGLPV